MTLFVANRMAFLVGSVEAIQVQHLVIKFHHGQRIKILIQHVQLALLVCCYQASVTNDHCVVLCSPVRGNQDILWMTK